MAGGSSTSSTRSTLPSLPRNLRTPYGPHSTLWHEAYLIVAFDIDYFKTLAKGSHAVALASWPDAGSLAEQLCTLDKDRARVAGMARQAVAFARENSQDIWLERRIAWTFEALDLRNENAAKGG